MGGGGAHGGGGSSQSLILTGDWPFQTDKCGAHIAELYWQGLVRHDMVIERGKVGRMIGSRGSNLQALRQTTNCEIFVLDKEGAPPGYGDDQRLIIIMGYDAQVAQGVMQIKNLLGSVPGLPSRPPQLLLLPAPAAPPPNPLSHEPPPPLPGGFVLGEQVYYTGESKTFESGDWLEHGKQGEVVAPATGESHKGNGVRVRFPGNKGATYCYLNQVRRRAAAAKNSSPWPDSCPSSPHPSHNIPCGCTGKPRAATAAAGRLLGRRAGLLHGEEPHLRERRPARARQAGRGGGARDWREQQGP